MNLETSVGALRFRFGGTRSARLPGLPVEPFVVMTDGTVVSRMARRGRQYLVVDHRRDVECVARVERWRALTGGEGVRPTLLVLCDAA